MFGGLEGTEEELLYVDDKMYPRRKIETIQRLMEELDEDDLKEWLIRDILKPKGKKRTRVTKPKNHAVYQEPIDRLESMFAELEPVNKIVDFKSPAQKEFAVSEAIKVAKKKGRPKMYHTEEERKQAKREKTVASNKRKALERSQKKTESDEDEDDFPINQIIEPISKTGKPLGSGIKKIVKRRLGETVRGDIVAEYIRKHKVPLGVASQMVKKLGLY
jgi:hypothetical protein